MLWVRIGALVCFFAVVLGAFGAHALDSTLRAHHSRDTWNTAVLYHFLQGLALVVLGFHQANRVACYLFLIGIILFSGSLYALSLSGMRWFGAITPAGGICFLAGWAWLFFSSR